MIELENSFAQSKQRHEEQIAEVLAEAKRQLDAQHKKQMEEMMSGIRVMLDQMRPLLNASQPSQVLKMLHLI